LIAIECQPEGSPRPVDARDRPATDVVPRREHHRGAPAAGGRPCASTRSRAGQATRGNVSLHRAE